MQKLIALMSLCAGLSANAQDSIPIRTVEPEKDFGVFISGGAALNNGFQINRYLEQNNIVPIEKAEFNLLAGILYFSDKIDIELAYDMQVNGKSNETTKYRTISNGVKLRSQWQVLRLRKVNFGVGLNIGYSHRKLSLYWKDASVDFNDLGDGIRGNQLTMFLERATIGPSVSVRLKNLTRRTGQTKFTLSYEIGMNEKTWQPAFFELRNRITEGKMAQVLLNLSLIL